MDQCQDTFSLNGRIQPPSVKCRRNKTSKITVNHTANDPMPARIHRPPQQGFTLIEVLVALLILSFGMLGLIGMQAFALQSNRDAKLYSEGTNLARELAEMMRGNNLIAIKTDTVDNPYLTNTLQAGTDDSDCLAVGGACTTTKDVAAAQMTEWRTRVRNAFPGARVEICFDAEPYDGAGLPQWDCTAGTAGVNEVIVLKLGWTIRSTDSSATDANANIGANDNGSRPQIILPVTGGNPFPL